MWWSESESFLKRLSWVLLPFLLSAALLGSILAKSMVPLAIVVFVLVAGIIGSAVALLPVAAAALLSRVLRRK